AVARQLLNKGHQVRALTRSPGSSQAVALEEAGAEVVGGDLEDRRSCTSAAQGVDAIFAMATPFEAGLEAEVRQGENMLAAAKAEGVQHLVYSSVASADQSTGIPHFDSKFEIEQKIENSGVPYTIVAPVYFMENLFAPWTISGLQEGKLAMAVPNSRVPQQIALEDIAGFVVLALESRDRFLANRIDIAGDEVTGEEAAEIISRASGRGIEYVEIPPEQRNAMGEDVAKMLDWFDETGYSVDIEAQHRQYPEVDWHTYEKWAKAQDWSVLKEPGDSR
ncbi:MAG: NmrA/HSCARG family protein, partial [Actinobacteria bacterium]|nr:NmrA/HSCARG family protein [Actinomycetota bacterium]